MTSAIESWLPSSPEAFDEGALELYRTQSAHLPVYREYLGHLGINASKADSVAAITFLPIAFFKSHRINTHASSERIFLSSGTTGNLRSAHHVADLGLYDDSLQSSFELFYGPIADTSLIAFLPSSESLPESSLVYMVEKLIGLSHSPHSHSLWNDTDRFIHDIESSLRDGRKTIAITLSYRWLELAQRFPSYLHGAILMETGGMKGHREMIRQELHDIMIKAFHVSAVHSEYGMTELLSQAYSLGHGRFMCPPWMRVLIRDILDPFSVLPSGQAGAINIIDLANRNSCAFIATDDLGRIHDDGSFEVLGRLDNSDVRGCNLL